MIIMDKAYVNVSILGQLLHAFRKYCTFAHVHLASQLLTILHCSFPLTLHRQYSYYKGPF